MLLARLGGVDGQVRESAFTCSFSKFDVLEESWSDLASTFFFGRGSVDDL